MSKKPKRDASDLKTHIGYWMRVVSNSVSQSFARKLGSSGVTVAEWVVLREMYGSGDTTSPSVVAELTGLTRGAVSKLIDRLLRKGFVTRSEASGDRRYQDIRLTSHAVSLVPRLAALADQNDEEFFNCLGKVERSALKGLLKKLADHHQFKAAPMQ